MGTETSKDILETKAILNPEELERYDRQIIIKKIGLRGQERLKQARIVIAGVGGLGSSVALYLAAAGIGFIRIIDYDDVEISNLNRQVLHWTSDIGRKKVTSAMDKLKSLNPMINVEIVDQKITEYNVLDMLSGVDLIVDAMDNLETRFLLNTSAIEKGLPLFHGAVRALEGRVMTIIPGKTACLRCIYKGVMPEVNCPILGVLPAVVGSLQATEVIKYIIGIGELLTDKILAYDALNMTFTELRVKKDPNCPHCGSSEKEKLNDGGKNTSAPGPAVSIRQ